MTKLKIPFSKPYFPEEDIDHILKDIKETLKSGWLTNAKKVMEFERNVAEYVEAKYAIAFNSCTAALHALMWALNVKSGDEIIVPSNTFVATANAVLYVGGKPVFADIDLKTFNVSPKDIEQKITDRTKGIIVVHLGGNPADMKEIMSIAEEYNLFVIEDAAHALGSIYQGKKIGSISLASAFSFYPTKIITTGEGGIVTTDDHELAEKLRMIRNHGRAGIGPAAIVTIGHNFRMTEFSAILGISQIKRLEEFIKRRNEIAAFYNRKLSKIKWIQPQKIIEGNRSNYYAYIVLLKDPPLPRDELINYLKNKGIGTSILYKPVHLQPLYRNLFGYKRGYLTNTEYFGDNTIALPLYNDMSMREANEVIEAINLIERGEL